ncbi:MAG: ion transporter [Chromatiaceae bacterium]|nr:ion transporter [Gammaproteobacteria bacterium]MCP5447044.1 ion transporter [Chromatiaceae bacterium]
MISAALSRQRIAHWVETPPVQYYIVGLILINAIVLGLETSSEVMTRWGGLLVAVDRIILALFTVEIGLRIYGHSWRFFRDPWGVFDFTIVAIALIPASGPLAVLRALRVLRVLRLVSMMPQLRFVVEALLSAIPGISAIAGLMLILYYVFAVMATGLFGATHPEWFGNVGASMYTLFQVMTLESWSMGIVRPLMESHAYAWVFFIPFILVATFTILNLFIAIIVNTMQNMHEKALHTEQAAIEGAIKEEGVHVEVELRALRAEITALRCLLQRE